LHSVLASSITSPSPCISNGRAKFKHPFKTIADISKGVFQILPCCVATATARQPASQLASSVRGNVRARRPRNDAQLPIFENRKSFWRNADVRFWHKADIPTGLTDVRFRG